MQDQQACRIDAGLHVGEHIGHALVLNDRLVKLHPVTGVTQCCLEGRTGDAQCLGANADSPAFQVGQGNGQPLAALAEHIGFRHAAAVEGYRAGVRGADAHFVFGAVDNKTGGGGGYQKRRNTFFAQIRVGYRKDNGQFGALAIADKLLGTGNHPLTVTQLGAGAQVMGFGAGLGFGQTEAGDGLAAGQLRQPGLFLCLAAVFQYRPAAHRIVDAHQGAGSGIAR